MIKKQMEMFDEGGLEQDGGTVDPVSGNDVPVGSTQEEVRDDIPAQLSEGEFVFPADVVRFIGLNNLMEMRQQAKAGLKKMEAMGQMGNSDEATMPDDVPFTSDDITVEDDDGNEGDLEMNVGGVVYQPSQVGSQFNIAPQQQQQMYQPPMYQPMPMPQQQTGYVPSFGMQPQQPQQYTGFQSLIPMPTQKYENVSYINKTTGETMVIPHVGGKPVFNPPEGFTRIKAGEEPKPTEDTKVDETIDTSVPTATVTKPYDKEGDSTTFENMQKRENAIKESYKNTIKSVMESEGLSSKDAIQFIKDGNYKVLGKSVPGFLFPDIELANQDRNQQKIINYGLEDAAADAVEEIKTENVGLKPKVNVGKIYDKDFKIKEKPTVVQTSTAEGSAGEKEAQDALKVSKIGGTSSMAMQQAASQAANEARKAEAEANRAKAREEKAFKDFKEKQEKVSGYAPDFKKGGIASKPTKKAMKRGGLASKK